MHRDLNGDRGEPAGQERHPGEQAVVTSAEHDSGAFQHIDRKMASRLGRASGVLIREADGGRGGRAGVMEVGDSGLGDEDGKSWRVEQALAVVHDESDILNPI